MKFDIKLFNKNIKPRTPNIRTYDFLFINAEYYVLNDGDRVVM